MVPRAPASIAVFDHGDTRKSRSILAKPEVNRSLWDTHGSVAEVGSSSREALRTVSEYVIYAPQTAVMRGITEDSRAAKPLGLTGGRLPQAFREVLKQRVDTYSKEIDDILKIIWSSVWAKQVRIGPPDLDVIPDTLSASNDVVYFVDKFMANKRNMLSPYDASEGTLFLLFVATILAHAESPPIFALDNVDGTLNPPWSDHWWSISWAWHVANLATKRTPAFVRGRYSSRAITRPRSTPSTSSSRTSVCS